MFLDEQKKYPEAKAVFEQAIALSPRNDNYYYKLLVVVATAVRKRLYHLSKYVLNNMIIIRNLLPIVIL